MNDMRRTILWIIFVLTLITLWDKWQIHNGQNPTFFPPPSVSATSTSNGNASDSNKAPAPTSANNSSTNDVPSPSLGNTINQIDSTQPASAQAMGKELIEITTDVFKLTFDTQGASLVKAELLQHRAGDTKDSKNQKDEHFVLLNESRDRVYIAQTGLIGGAFPTHKTNMKLVSDARELAQDANELVVRFESPEMNGVKLIKSYVLKRGKYAIDVQHEISNASSAAISPQLYVQLIRDGNKPSGESSFYSTFTGPAIYTDAKKFQKVDFTDIEKNKVSIEKQADNGYVAMVQHYFFSAWLIKQGILREFFMRKVDSNLYSAGFFTTLPTIEAGSHYKLDAQLYVGPQDEKIIESLAPGLELVKDYGYLTILAKPLYMLLDLLHNLIGNWGWAIVGLVVLLKIAFYWLNAKAYASMAKMKSINPKITEIRERFKDKPQQLQQEMMRIYREEKVNPMGGCFPILIQIPVFIALYSVLLASVEMRNAPWIGWIHDLSAPDPFFILPLLMTATTMLQTWLNPTPPDPMQAKIMWIMPLVFSVMFFFFPSGLVLYWITNNILSIAQQWIINRRLGVS